MISLDDYFGPYAKHPDATPERWAAAAEMLDRVNQLLERAAGEGVEFLPNPATGTLVSGAGNGGFRPQNCPVGAARSSHKLARAVDIADPSQKLDDWLTDGILREFGLYREHPDYTLNWCHLQDKAPPSGRSTFRP